MERKPGLDKDALDKLLKEMMGSGEGAEGEGSGEDQGTSGAGLRQPAPASAAAPAPPPPSPITLQPSPSPQPRTAPPEPPAPGPPPPPTAARPSPTPRMVQPAPSAQSLPPSRDRQETQQQADEAAPFKGPVEIEVRGLPPRLLLDQLQGEVSRVPGLTYQGVWASARGAIRLRLRAERPLPLPQLLRQLPSVADLQVKETAPVLKMTASLGEKTPQAQTPPVASPQRTASLSQGEATFSAARLPGVGDLFRLQEVLRAWPEVRAIHKATTTPDGRGAILTLDLGKELALEEIGGRLGGAEVELEEGNRVKVALPPSW